VISGARRFSDRFKRWPAGVACWPFATSACGRVGRPRVRASKDPKLTQAASGALLVSTSQVRSAGLDRRVIRFLRVHLMQNWFALSDPAMDALYEIASLRSFAALKLSEPIPDETTILNVRHMLEE
jgi:hypothetical protein